MADVLRIATSVGTPLALLGLVAALGYFAYIRRLKHEESKLEALPPDKRASIADEHLTRYGIDGKNLPPADKLTLIKNEMDKRHRRALWYVISTAVVFVLCFGLAVLAYAIQSPGPVSSPQPTKVTVRASDQKYHIIRGATEAPYLFPPIQGELTDLSTIRDEVVKQVLSKVSPVNMQVDLSITGSSLRFSRSVDIYAAGGGIQGYGSHRKIAQANPTSPLDLDRLWAGDYPGGYFRPKDRIPKDRIALWLQAEDGNLKGEQVIVRKESSGYFFGKDANQTSTTSSLNARPSVIVVDDFSSAGRDEAEARRIAVILRDAIREGVSRNNLLKLSPHSVSDIERVHSELKEVPPNDSGKNLLVAAFAVDHIISGSVVVE